MSQTTEEQVRAGEELTDSKAVPNDRDRTPGRWRAPFDLLCLSAALLLLAVGTSCQSPSQYVSPRITGRVVDGKTRQPVQNVQVRRWSEASRSGSMDTQKGTQLLDDDPFVRSGADGTFVLRSERSLAFLRQLGWYPVTLTFAHPDYESSTQSFAEARATNSPSGEPVVQTGDVLLQPLAK